MEVPGCGAALDLGRRIEIVARHPIGPADVAEGRDRAERHHRALVAARLQPADLAQLLAERSIGLGRDPEGAAEQVEVVDVDRADIDLERFEHLLGRDAEHLRLHPVDVGVDLGRAGVEQREHVEQAGGLVGGGDQRLGRRLERLEPAAAAVLDHHLEAAGGADAAHRRRHDHDDERLLEHAVAL